MAFFVFMIEAGSNCKFFDPFVDFLAWKHGLKQFNLDKSLFIHTVHMKSQRPLV